MSDYRYLETSALRATETATTLRALESYAPAGAGTDVLLEPFNNFTFAPWTNVGGFATIVAGRTGTAAQTSGGGQQATYDIAAPNQSDTLTVGFAWRRTDAAPTVQRDIVRFNSDAGVTNHNRLSTNPSTTTLLFTRGATAVATNPAVTFTQNTWYYIEVQTKLHDTTGSVIVRVNGVEAINANTLDTKNGGTKTVYDQLLIGAFTGSTIGQYDDLYLTMGAGAPFKGSITIP